MNPWWVIGPLLATTIIYAVTSGGYWFALRRPGMALAFAGYVLANVGLIWDALTTK